MEVIAMCYLGSVIHIEKNNGSMSNNVGDNLNQQNLLNYAAASIAN